VGQEKISTFEVEGQGNHNRTAHPDTVTETNRYSGGKKYEIKRINK